MKLWPRNTYGNLKRVKEILGVFIKYGFYNQLNQLGLLKHLRVHPVRKNLSNDKDHLARGQRVRMALEELGTTFIKFGQILSTRRDLLPADIIVELENLQDDVAPISFEMIKKIIEEELQGELQDLFWNFEKKPLATASIAQVHEAQLKDGKRVVVKIQRPEIEKNISSDIGILEEVASFLDHRTKYSKLYDFTALARDFKESLYKELDFHNEARNINIFRKNFKNNKNIFFPLVYEEYTTEKILTMEYIQGNALRDIESSGGKNFNPVIIAERLTTSILEQILRDGFFHGDPHPGNIRVLSENRIVFLDMGIVGQLGEKKREQFFRMIVGITLRNSKLMVQAISEIGTMGESIDFKRLEKEIDRMKDQYLEVPLKEIQIGKVLNEIFLLAFQYHITIPNEFAMLVKTLIILEGLVAKLDPSLNIVEIAQPITQKLLLDIYSPKKLAKDMGGSILDYAKLFRELPGSFLNILNKFDKKETQIVVHLKNEEKIIKTINKMANQLSFSVALLALSIVISGFIVGMSLQGNAFNIIGINFVKIGLMASVAMGLWLIVSIIRTGRF
ncbi:AarF/UbiB family protein [Irregularibacter muris]|uniref:AarF/UbiB family protein n=1 Tax=Irregularibacter muris TaxID=1796619 RepID=A0AAE3HF43_9FIRM|nr:AarF/UbiB family protein [Irregularibacter muris]MCR1898299.1 AarF/UbiB family protein [Irregularibacter muris]